MRYDSRLSKLFKAVSKEKSQGTLCAVNIDAIYKVAVATDGHIMAIIDVADLLDESEESFLIPVDALKAADKYNKKPNIGHVSIVSENGKIAVQTFATTVQTFDAVIGQFPNYNAVVPSIEEYQPAFSLSAELLLNLADTLRGSDPNSDTNVTLYMKDANSSLLVSGSGCTTYGVIMPCYGAYSIPKPFWRERPVKEEVA